MGPASDLADHRVGDETGVGVATLGEAAPALGHPFGPEAGPVEEVGEEPFGELEVGGSGDTHVPRYSDEWGGHLE